MKFIFFILLSMVSISLFPNIIIIPNDFPAIQEGINTANNQDTVLVYPGRYYENIDYLGKNIVVASLYLTTTDTSYINQTVIDASQSYRGVTFEHHEDSTAVLCGFTITGGNNNYGAAIYCFDHSSPTIIHCNITNNTSEEGGGFYGNYTSAKILNCKLTHSSGGGIYLVNHSTIFIDGCFIANNSTRRGGGIYMENHSNIVIKNTIIKDNYAMIYGGAIYCFGSCFSLENSKIQNNTSSYDCGGLYIKNSTDTLIVLNTQFESNNSAYDNGAVYTNNADIHFINCKIDNNSSNYGFAGGLGIYQYSNIFFTNCLIANNISPRKGGAIYSSDSEICLSGTTVKDNFSQLGGGIFCDDTSLFFNQSNLSNIYNNNNTSRGPGNDIFYLGNDTLNVIVDTFTVINPSDFYASPIEKFNFDILHSYQGNLINADLYVSPDGSNQNSGLTPSEPLKSLSYAMEHIYANQENYHTVYLSEGEYNYVNTLEHFPIYINSYITLQGESSENTIIDANYMGNILYAYFSYDVNIRNITFKRGSYSSGGAIYFYYSNGTVENCKFVENRANNGGAINIFYSDAVVNNCIFQNNQSYFEGGAFYINNASHYLTITNSLITNNTAFSGGAFLIKYSSYPYIVNCTIADNISQENGGAFNLGDHQYTHLINSILYNNQPQEIGFSNQYDSNDLYITFCDIQGGYDAIVQNENSSVSVYENNLDQNPMFAYQSDSPYQLSANSPCIDSGTYNLPQEVFLPDYDLNGSPRFEGINIDMGAYEYLNSFSNENDIVPENFSAKNYPNPFNPSTKIEYNCPANTKVSILIFNSKGQLIKKFNKFHKENGKYKVLWEGNNNQNIKVTSGIYFYKIIFNGKTKLIGKMALVK